ncbi:MAG: penicillin acylase family protein [Bacteroidetes bacterium]|nr:penicillin acylase family protein [Bacteroidota bacterium]
MKKIKIEGLFPLAALVLLIIALSGQIFMVPPLGKILDPFTGLFRNGDDALLDAPAANITVHGVRHPVEVYLDERKVPHLFAQDVEDLYFAQGYVAASFRLWQMDILSYVAAGRLSEIFREGFLNQDRVQRRTGLPDAARASLASMEKEPETMAALLAYTRGVNAYIASLDYKSLPIEYKILDYRPEPWSPLKTVLIMKSMASLLSGYDDDLTMTNLMLAMGEKTFNKLYPNFDVHSAPVVPDSAGKVNEDLLYIRKPDYLDFSFLNTGSTVPSTEFNPKLGSNGWVVSGTKTGTAHPILCNDPHLNLSLPAVWMEMQLSTPGMNVYGVSIPGTPAVIIGFNRDIAWGLTNGADDVKDWYKLRVRDDYKKYFLDGRWLELPYSVEEIKRRGQRPVYDTIYHTVHGPIPYTKSFPGSQGLADHALRWELAHASNEIRTFLELARAKDYSEYRAAIRHYACPIQNFMFACKNNDIAVDHQGRMPVKWPGQGKFILDGTRSAHDYGRYIPEDSLPRLFNPACGYLFSANQQPTSQRYPYYYNGAFVGNRAQRIKDLLAGAQKFDVGSMQKMQLDNTNFFALTAAPVLLGLTDSNRLSVAERGWLGRMSRWKGKYDRNDELAPLFEKWWKNMRESTWDELRQYSFYAKTPDDRILLGLLQNEPENPYFDRIGTTQKETAKDLVLDAFKSAVAEIGKRRAEGRSEWGDYNTVSLMHISNLGLFSRLRIPSSGHPEAINAVSQKWGPSWRMIVELGERPKAYGIYAGGQSGTIGSPHYDQFVDDWNKGVYYDLHYYENPAEARAGATASWNIN